jgi:hypothetical protein
MTGSRFLWSILAIAGTALALERGKAMTESRFSMVHVRMTPDGPFADVQAAFERRLARFEPDVYQALADGGNPAAVRARLQAMAGSSGFMLFGTTDNRDVVGRHGRCSAGWARPGRAGYTAEPARWCRVDAFSSRAARHVGALLPFRACAPIPDR